MSATGQVANDAGARGTRRARKTIWPFSTPGVLTRIAHELRGEIEAWLRALRFTVWAVRGRTPGGHSMCLLYAGSMPYMHYLKQRAFAGAVEDEPLGRRWFWQLGRLSRRVGADLAIVRSTRRLRWLTHRRGTYWLPEWCWCEIRLGPDALASGAHGAELRKLRKKGLEYAVTTDPAALRHFYERMYVPMMRASHGEGALLMSPEQMLRRVQAGESELVSILKQGTAVGGGLIVHDHGMARVFSIGVLDANREYLRGRVGVAIYYYTFALLVARGYRRVGLGRSRPFLLDGPLVFKKRLGGEIKAPTRDGVVLRLLRQSDAAMEFLVANPFICLERDGLHARAFVAGEPSSAATAELEHRLSMPGVMSFRVQAIASRAQR